MKRPPCHSLGQFASTCILHRLAERRKACHKIEKTTSRAGAALGFSVHHKGSEEQAKAPKTKRCYALLNLRRPVTFRYLVQFNISSHAQRSKNGMPPSKLILIRKPRAQKGLHLHLSLNYVIMVPILNEYYPRQQLCDGEATATNRPSDRAEEDERGYQKEDPNTIQVPFFGGIAV